MSASGPAALWNRRAPGATIPRIASDKEAPVSKPFDFKWRKTKASAPDRKHETVKARTPEPRIQQPPATTEALSVLAPAAARPRPSHERIAVRAYELWEKRGWPEGADLGNWFDAERQLLSEPG